MPLGGPTPEQFVGPVPVKLMVSESTTVPLEVWQVMVKVALPALAGAVTDVLPLGPKGP